MSSAMSAGSLRQRGTWRTLRAQLADRQLDLWTRVGGRASGSVLWTTPTLLIQGEHDFVTATESVRALHGKLAKVGVPAVYVELPATEHAFDIPFPRYSPAAQAALSDLGLFLALMAGG